MNDLNIDFDKPLPPAEPKIGNFTPEPPKPGKARQFGKMLTGKFAMSLLCTAIVGTCLNADRAYKAFRFFCSILSGFADPETSERITKLFHKGEEAASKVEARIDAPPGESKPSLKEKLTEKVAARAMEPLKEKVEETKEKAVEKVVEVKAEAKEKVEEVKTTITTVGDKLGQGARIVGNKAAEVGHNAKEGLGTMRQNMAEANAQARIAAAHRAQCPRCHVSLNLPIDARKTRTCLSCGAQYTPAAARHAAQRGGFR